jgi:hypothetical protein
MRQAVEILKVAVREMRGLARFEDRSDNCR